MGLNVKSYNYIVEHIYSDFYYMTSVYCLTVGMML